MLVARLEECYQAPQECWPPYFCHQDYRNDFTFLCSIHSHLHHRQQSGVKCSLKQSRSVMPPLPFGASDSEVKAKKSGHVSWQLGVKFQVWKRSIEVLSLELNKLRNKGFHKRYPPKCLQPQQCIFVVVQESLKVKPLPCFHWLHIALSLAQKKLQIVKPFQGFWLFGFF